MNNNRLRVIGQSGYEDSATRILIKCLEENTILAAIAMQTRVLPPFLIRCGKRVGAIAFE